MIESEVSLSTHPKLKRTILIEGLPGIGLVANTATAHLIRELKAKKFGEIRSPFFQDFAITGSNGEIQTPTVELYYSKLDKSHHDLLFIQGNTQALTPYGQYELCGKIVEVAQDFNCYLIACMGGLRKKDTSIPPKVYCAALDFTILNKILAYNLDVVGVPISGAAGLLMGLGKLRGIPGFAF
ncbi:MAG: PAC2 family protein [Candidatus Bathyarchaeota archaeon]